MALTSAEVGCWASAVPQTPSNAKLKPRRTTPRHLLRDPTTAPFPRIATVMNDGWIVAPLAPADSMVPPNAPQGLRDEVRRGLGFQTSPRAVMNFAEVALAEGVRVACTVFLAPAAS